MLQSPVTPPRPGETLIAASHNPGKARELRALLEPFDINVVSAAELKLPEPDETEDSFVGNAALKAMAAARRARLPAIADDSGLCVHALGDAPGIYSARWGGPGRNFGLAMRRVETKLREKGATYPMDRTAHFVCALAFARPAEGCVVVEGRVDGRLVWPPRGRRGFGYDPVFVAEGMGQSFGEIDPELKHAISHRADAFEQLLALWGR